MQLAKSNCSSVSPSATIASEGRSTELHLAFLSKGSLVVSSWSPSSQRSMTGWVAMELPGVPCTPTFLLRFLTPPPSGECEHESRIICTINRHSFSGYAALGAVFHFSCVLPISLCWWWCPQLRLSGPMYFQCLSNLGSPKWQRGSSTCALVRSLVGLGYKAPNWHWWIAKVDAAVCTIKSWSSSHCQIDPGCSPSTRPKSSGCSSKNFPPAAAENRQAARHCSMKLLASSTICLLWWLNQGKPLGHVLLRSGLGPGCFLYWKRARLKLLHGGDTIKNQSPCCSSAKIDSQSCSSLKSWSGPRSISISLRTRLNWPASSAARSNEPTSDCRLLPAKRYMTLSVLFCETTFGWPGPAEWVGPGPFCQALVLDLWSTALWSP